MIASVLRALKSAVHPLIPEALRVARYEKEFFRSCGWKNLHLGRFDSFREARQFAERRQVVAHYEIDHRSWLQDQGVLKPHDYPILFWLDRLLTEGDVLVDLGGSVGVSFYTYSHRLHYPEHFQWRVCELADAVLLGRQLAHERNAHQLVFTEDRGALNEASILLAAGALQFIESNLPALLRDVPQPPTHVLINRLALTPTGPAYVTLQNTGHSITPCKVDTLQAFVSGIEHAGYTLIDTWRCLENSIRVPFHPECSLRHFYGFYFARSDSRTAAP